MRGCDYLFIKIALTLKSGRGLLLSRGGVSHETFWRKQFRKFISIARGKGRYFGFISLKSSGLQVGCNLQFSLTLFRQPHLYKRLSQSIVSVCDLVIVVLQIRIQRDRFLEGFNCFVVLLQTLICLAEEEIRIRIVRLNIGSFL